MFKILYETSYDGGNFNNENHFNLFVCVCLRINKHTILTTLDVQLDGFYMAHILLSQNYQFLHFDSFQSAQSYGVVLCHFCVVVVGVSILKFLT